MTRSRRDSAEPAARRNLRTRRRHDALEETSRGHSYVSQSDREETKQQPDTRRNTRRQQAITPSQNPAGSRRRLQRNNASGVRHSNPAGLSGSDSEEAGPSNRGGRSGRAPKRNAVDDSFEVTRPEGAQKQMSSYLSDHEIQTKKAAPSFKTDMLFKSTAHNNQKAETNYELGRPDQVATDEVCALCLRID